MTKPQNAPWKPAEFPDVHAWLVDNEKALALVRDAATRPRLAPPKPQPGEEPGLPRLPFGTIRAMAMALTAHAMERVAAGDPEAAHTDILAVHRLAQLLADAPDLLTVLVALPLDRETRIAELAALRTLDKHAAAIWFHQCLALPPLRMGPAAVDIGARFSDLNMVMLAIRGHVQETLEALTFLNPEPLFTGRAANDAILNGNLAEVDWNIVLRHINAVDDEATAIVREPDPLKRLAAAQHFSQELADEKVPGNLFSDVMSKAMTGAAEGTLEQRMEQERNDLLKKVETFLRRGDTETRQAYSLRIAQLFTHSESTLHKCIELAVKNDAQSQIYTAAMALDVYKADHSQYPDNLDALTTTYLNQPPLDLFSGKPPIYRRDGAGYILYSLGPNARDDHGENDLHDKDDIAIRQTAK